MSAVEQLYGAYEPIPFDAQSVHTALETLLADQSLGRVFVLESGNDFAGYLVLTFGFSVEYGGRDAFIDELFVDEAFRRTGVGTRAIEEAATLCRTLGIRVLHLEVDLENAGAERLYRRLGFEAHSRRLMHLRL